MFKKCTETNEVFEYMKTFLRSKKINIMERCYKSIRDTQRNRCFDNSIAREDCSLFDSKFPIVSSIILTANKFECDSLNYIFSTQKDSLIVKRKLSLQIFEDSNYCATDAYLITYKSFIILHLNACETGSNTTGGSTDIVRYISRNKFLKPNCIISFGICYGRDPKNQNIGDVLIPKKLYPWSIGQKIKESSTNKNHYDFKIKHDNFNINFEKEFSKSKLYNCANSFCNGEEGNTINEKLEIVKLRQKTKSLCEFSINIKMGNMSTGEAVVSSKDIKDAIKNSTKIENELGGEMEGYGIAKECVYYAKIPCLIIKSICDWGEFKDIDKKLEDENIFSTENLKDKLQAYASFCSGIALIKFLDISCDELLGLGIIEWMSNKERKNRICNNLKFASKEVIIKNIMVYYNVDKYEAETVFKLLCKNKYIIQVPQANKYKTLYQQEY